MTSTPAIAPDRKKPGGLGAGWEMLLVFAVGLGVSVVNDYLCLAVFSGLVYWLVIRHYDSPADVIGIVFSASCAVPLFRRVHDLYHGFRPGSMLLVAQYISYPLLAGSVIKDLRKFRHGRFLPLILSGVGVMWAFCVGLLDVGIFPASMQLLEFSSGLILFAYVMVLNDRFDVSKFTKWLFVLGIVEGIYGVVQWVVIPAWDSNWFNASGMNTAGGVAMPFQLRTFGTLNSTSHYAYFLFFTLVVTVANKGYFLAAPLMIAGLATTLGRSTWGATVLGWFVVLLLAKGKDKPKVVMPLLSTFGLALLLALPFASRLESLGTRLQSMTNIKNDNSFKDRAGLLDAALEGGAFEDPVGVGFGLSGAAAKESGKGVVGIDNGFLAIAWIFGWVGSFFFLGGFFVGMFRGLLAAQTMPFIRLPFLGAMVGLFLANLFESAFSGIKGPMVWISLGITNLWFVERAKLKAAARNAHAEDEQGERASEIPEDALPAAPEVPSAPEEPGSILPAEEIRESVPEVGSAPDQSAISAPIVPLEPVPDPLGARSPRIGTAAEPLPAAMESRLVEESPPSSTDSIAEDSSAPAFEPESRMEVGSGAEADRTVEGPKDPSASPAPRPEIVIPPRRKWILRPNEPQPRRRGQPPPQSPAPEHPRTPARTTEPTPPAAPADPVAEEPETDASFKWPTDILRFGQRDPRSKDKPAN